jgi:tRNA-(ms[2]io[6]A)-hydroxylase
MSILLYPTSPEWVQTVLDNFDSFLIDHAAAEKKASGMAISMISHYPDRQLLVESMAELAVEELNHYREVIKILHSRNLQLGTDGKDPYVISFRKSIRDGAENYFMDRLLIGGIIEARGAERFGLIADALQAGKLKDFYHQITASECDHRDLFKRLAENYFDPADVQQRHDELLIIEAGITQDLPVRAALH